MDDARWERLRQYLARARSMPTFDTEERAFRLEIAEEVRAAIRLAAERGPWTDRLRAIIAGIHGRRHNDITEHIHNRWLRTLPDPESLGLALSCFLDDRADPVERFSSFVQAAAERQPQLLTAPEDLAEPDAARDAALAIGALLNFGAAPTELPAVHLEVWNLVEQTLGCEWSFRRTLEEQYRCHLAFAGDVERRLREAAIEVHDMLDTQALIHIAGTQADFWMTDRPKNAKRSGPPYELAICAIYRDEADYLAEWIEFHRLVGVERFFLYNNFSEDHHREVLDPYIEEGIVTVRDWPVLDGRVGQIAAYNDYLRWHREEARWTAFIDLDEFFFSPGGDPLPAVLADYEEFPAVAVRWAMFGPAGHRTKPEGLVMKNYQLRMAFDSIINMKTVACAALTTRCLTAHHFEYQYLSAVDELRFPVQGPRTATDSAERLRLNHYHWKSEEEYLAKCVQMRAIGRPREVPTAEHFEWLRKSEKQSVPDDAILAYLPSLEKALTMRAHR